MVASFPKGESALGLHPRHEVAVRKQIPSGLLGLLAPQILVATAGLVLYNLVSGTSRRNHEGSP